MCIYIVVYTCETNKASPKLWKYVRFVNFIIIEPRKSSVQDTQLKTYPKKLYKSVTTTIQSIKHGFFFLGENLEVGGLQSGGICQLSWQSQNPRNPLTLKLYDTFTFNKPKMPRESCFTQLIEVTTEQVKSS